MEGWSWRGSEGLQAEVWRREEGMRARGRGVGRGTLDREEEEAWSQETPFVSSGLVVPGESAVSHPQFQSGDGGL